MGQGLKTLNLKTECLQNESCIFCQLLCLRGGSRALHQGGC